MARAPGTPEPEIDLKISIDTTENRQLYARYRIPENHGIITQYLPAIQDLSRIGNEGVTDENQKIENLIDAMIYTYLAEYLCVQRYIEGIRIPGGRCNPCCVDPIVGDMLDHIWGVCPTTPQS
jgi:hypothetical protein